LWNSKREELLNTEGNEAEKYNLEAALGLPQGAPLDMQQNFLTGQSNPISNQLFMSNAIPPLANQEELEIQ
jgi:hypothetical protein